MEIFVSILVMIVILGVLISLHEAGHLGMAKLFKIYCYEYSIGFGPKLLKVKSKNAETYFSIRVIPLGGYVSMYGEAGSLPEEAGEIPEERSLESKKLWQKILVMVAGVVVNYLLGLILIFISVSCFKVYYSGYAYLASVNETTISASYAPIRLSEGSEIYENVKATLIERDSELSPNDHVLYVGTDYYLEKDGATYNFSVLDGFVTIEHKKADGTYEKTGDFAALYSPQSRTGEHDLANDIALFPLLEDEAGEYIETDAKTTCPDLVPYQIDFHDYFATDPTETKTRFTLSGVTGEGTYRYELSLIFLPKMGTEDRPISKENASIAWEKRVEEDQVVLNTNERWKSFDVAMLPVGIFNTFKEACDQWCYYVPEANIAIIRGIGSIFTSGITNLSGIVGMTAQLGQVMEVGGAGLVFRFAGILSINLAIFNLLPFPGLDGWQILSSCIEAGIRRKLNPKVKSILSYVGLGLLILLAVAVTIKDIIGLVI